jgi:hypothetical protein
LPRVLNVKDCEGADFLFSLCNRRRAGLDDFNRCQGAGFYPAGKIKSR